MAGGFKKSSNNLPADVRGSARRTGVSRPGSKEEDVAAKSSDKNNAKAQAPRRAAAEGGSNNSVMQSAIGGPYGNRSGNRESKTARIDGMS